MQPLIYTNLAYTLGFFAVFLLWAASEFLGPVRWGRARKGQRRDRGSLLLAFPVGIIALVLALVLPVVVPTLIMSQPTSFFVGIALVLAGIAWRWYAIRTLGRFFTANVLIQQDQHIITTGPYRFIRHPSYTGVLVVIAGMGCMIGNWGSLVCMVLGMLIPLLYRISIEERALCAAFASYAVYQQHTKRLIPFVY